MPTTLEYRFRVRRRTAANWTSINEVLLDSEIGRESDSSPPKIKIGDGVTAWNDLPYFTGDLTDVLTAADVDTDGTLAADSDAKVPSQKAVRTYVNQIVAAQDAMVFKGVIDCSANPNYPAADRGWTWRASVAGKIGGASGVVVQVGDIILCLTDSTASGDQATVGAHWTVIQTNIDGALLTTDIGVSVQAFDADLTALAANGANGLWARTGAGSGAARTLTGTAAEIAVTNGDGVGGNPIFSLPAAMTLTGKTLTGGSFTGGAFTGVTVLDLTGATFPRIKLNRSGVADWYIGNPTAGGTGNSFAIVLNSTTKFELFSTGDVLLPLPTYADNAAAVSGGLSADHLYKTATGEVRVVV